MWLIKLNAVNDGRIVTQKYIDDTRLQIEDLNIPVIFGKLVCDMSQWTQSQIYFQRLLNDQHGEDLAWIEHSIGQAHHWKAEWNEARKHYDRSYDRMMHSEPVRIKDSAVLLSNICEILCLQGKYEEAFNILQQALAMQKRNGGAFGNIELISSLHGIGNILDKQNKYDEALDFYQRSLMIREKSEPANRAFMATDLTYIGTVLLDQKKYEEAFNFKQRALNIRETHIPSNYASITESFSQMGNV